MFRGAFTSVIFLMVVLSLPPVGFAQKNKTSSNKKVKPTLSRSKPAKVVQIKKAPTITRDQQFANVKKTYRHGEKGYAQLWSDLQDFDEKIRELSSENQLALIQLQASILQKSGYPYLAALYAAESIKKARNPYGANQRAAWLTLMQSSQKRSMQQLLEELAASLKNPTAVPGFNNSWYYYAGNAEQARGNASAAISNYNKLKINDYHFLSAKYQTAMIHLANERTGPAELALKTMLNSVSQTLANLDKETLKEMSNYAKLGLARLYYQNQKFLPAMKFYRAVDRDSNLFYDSLFEQSWAFFMAGYPNHSLGAVHSVESPFFKDVFNPESSMLRAINYYWMCRYDDSKAALADFTEKHSDAIESLTTFLARKRLSDEHAYQLFEDFVSGVSSQALGIPRTVLQAASQQDSMLYLRDQYAGLVAELDRLEGQGVFGSRNTKRASAVVERQIKSFRSRIGGQFITELQSLKKHFDRLYEQSQFLYVELLMSEKEQLLGRELHASAKMDRVTQRKNINGWGDKTQAWGDNRLNEFWWDEVGFYIYSVKPLCKTGS